VLLYKKERKYGKTSFSFKVILLVKTTKEIVLALMNQPDRIRNIGICAHIDHGKTTLSDNLLAGAGMISEELAGQYLWLDYDEQEQQRGITINAANVSMVHEFKGQQYLINLIDTPGHVDFGGDVTRAMRAVDGTIVVVCAVEGIMPQTETVLRQAIKERVKPVLFINKVDRLINELKVTPQAMQERFVKIIKGVNSLITSLAPAQFKKEWLVRVDDGSVAFGSAYHRWAINIPYMKESKITFADIINYYKEDRRADLPNLAPLHKIMLTMVIQHLPNPIVAQSYRVPKIWPGDLDSSVGKALCQCNPSGTMISVITKVTNDPHAGDVFTGRIFSGTLYKGQDVHLMGAKCVERIQQLGIYKGPNRIPVEKVPAGNIVAIIGIKSALSGETISETKVTPFEEIKHIFEPVVTKSIEAKNMSDLPKLIKCLRQIAREDPTIKVEINEETGEHLISGLGELHLEIWEYRIKTDKKIDIITSPPIVVYRETVTDRSDIIEGKSPNKHNKFYISVEPMDDTLYQALARGEIPSMRVKKKNVKLTERLVEFGMDRDEAKHVKSIYNSNIFIDKTRGIVHLHECMEMVLDSFQGVMDLSPLAHEKAAAIKVILHDVKLHEDAIHRGPGQVIPAVRDAIRSGIIRASAILLEPKQKIRIDAPVDYMGAITKLVQSKRGQILEMDQEGNQMVLFAKLPVSDMFGFTAELRSSTSGRGVWSLIDSRYERLPKELQEKVTMAIRKRKGLPPQLPKKIL
jgi:elongation factor 2